MRAFILNGGGLGDCFIRYFGLISGVQPGWGKLAALKQSTSCYVKAVLAVHNSAIIDFLRYNPLIDEIQFMEYSQNWADWKEAFKLEGWEDVDSMELPWTCPAVFVNPGDETWWQQLTGGRPYAVVHPFGGMPLKCLPPDIDLSGFKLPVFVIGASSYRFYRGAGSYLPEVLSPDYKGNAVSLTGVCNSRLAALLVSRAASFHGTFSAYCWVAHAFGVPSVVYLPENYPLDDHVRLAQALGMRMKLFKDFPLLS